jgi:hypothetical protein
MPTSDALVALSRLAGSALSHAVDEVVPARRRFPSRVGDIDAGWLEEALQEAHPGVRLSGFRVLDDHSGTTSRARIALDYLPAGGALPADGANDTSGPPDAAAGPPPATIFLKLTPASWATRLFVDVTGIGRGELSFYRHVRADLPVLAPGLLGVRSTASGRRFVLLLEDLEASGAHLATLGDRAELADAEAVMRALAKLHAHYWESPRFSADLGWLPSYENRRRQMPWERFVTGQMIGVALRQFREELGAEFERIALCCRDRRDLLERLWSVGQRTLVHGDCHQGNLFYLDGEVGFFDWQICARAPGMRDVSYFLCNSFPSELRRQHEEELIRLYLECLTEQLAERRTGAPDFDAAWRQHRLFALYTFIAAAFTAAAGSGLQSREIAMAGLRRATISATDLASVDCAEGR